MVRAWSRGPARGEEISRGDELFGQLLIAPPGSAGTYAEYVAVTEEAPLARVPDGLDPVVAAALPTAGGTGLALVASLGPLAGKSVLIVGAGGGVGSFATQFAVNAWHRTSSEGSPAVCSATLRGGRDPARRVSQPAAQFPPAGGQGVVTPWQQNASCAGYAVCLAGRGAPPRITRPSPHTHAGSPRDPPGGRREGRKPHRQSTPTPPRSRAASALGMSRREMLGERQVAAPLMARRAAHGALRLAHRRFQPGEGAGIQLAGLRLSGKPQRPAQCQFGHETLVLAFALLAPAASRPGQHCAVRRQRGRQLAPCGHASTVGQRFLRLVPRDDQDPSN